LPRARHAGTGRSRAGPGRHSEGRASPRPAPRRYRRSHPGRTRGHPRPSRAPDPEDPDAPENAPEPGAMPRRRSRPRSTGSRSARGRSRRSRSTP
jgi:hypothetical protein